MSTQLPPEDEQATGDKKGEHEQAAQSSGSLPARVRVTCPPLPLAPALSAAARKFCPKVPQAQLQAAAFAIAGGTVIGVALRWPGGEEQSIHTSWRGRGLEQELARVLSGVWPGRV